jgi:acyl-CoA dehydrogenase
MYTDVRHLRFADGPDEVHHLVVGRNELRAYEGGAEEVSASVALRT